MINFPNEIDIIKYGFVVNLDHGLSETINLNFYQNTSFPVCNQMEKSFQSITLS